MVSQLRTRPFLRTLFCALCLIAGGGCTAGAILTSTASKLFMRQDVNLTEKSYAAADYLIQQASNFVTKDHVIRATRLTNAAEPGMSSRFGLAVPEQVGTRLSQLGYKVDIAEVKGGADTGYLDPALAPGTKADYILGGTYLPERGKVAVNLRLTDSTTGRVYGSFDYVMPMSREISESSATEVQIYRVSE